MPRKAAGGGRVRVSPGIRALVKREQELGTAPDGSVADTAVELVGTGRLSVVAATAMAEARVREGGLPIHTGEKTRRLASCSSERQFHTRAATVFGTRLQYQTIELPVTDCGHGWQWQTLAPYEVLADMYATSIKQFYRSMFGNEDPSTVIPEIWLANPNHHIHTSAHLPLDKTIPLYFHMDGIDLYQGAPFRVFQVSSALAHDIDVEDAKLFAGAIDEHTCNDATN